MEPIEAALYRRRYALKKQRRLNRLLLFSGHEANGHADERNCQGSREFPRCDHENSPPVIAGRSDLIASRWARMR